MSRKAETVKCELCGDDTTYPGTRRCNRCWEKELETSKKDIQEKAFEKFISKIRENTRLEYEEQFKLMEEDAAMYKGLYLKVKRAFQEVLDEQASACYDLWERFEKEIPRVQEKVEFITSQIRTVTEECEMLDSLLNKINTYGLGEVLSAMRELSGLYGKNKEMFEFLVNNFQPKE